MAPSKQQAEAMNLYAKLMQEAKLRIKWMEYAVNGRTGLPGPLVREFSFLQLRMLCELIALACLTAHGEITAASKLRKEYSADRIVSLLSELHPSFYPRPVEQVKLSSDEAPIDFELRDIKDGFLTKDELPVLVAKCGSVLHRGTVKKLLSQKSPIQTNFPEIAEWTLKISKLLGLHVTHLFGGSRYFLCSFKHEKQPPDGIWVGFVEGYKPM
ncbi:MAG: hypothetical protein AB7K64_01135 [Variibacter sp.]